MSFFTAEERRAIEDYIPSLSNRPPGINFADRLEEIFADLASGVADVDFGTSGLQTDLIAESTAAAGVTVDGCLIKDGRADAIATASMFKSTEITGTGSAQNTAHSFGSTPSLTYAVFTELPADLTAGADIAEGSHDATNCIFTVTSGIKYKVIAFK